MAQAAASYLMSALGRRLGAEDRLTELLACVLAGDPELCRVLLALVELDQHRVVGIETQVATGQGLCTTDMRLSLEGEAGQRMSLWSEHKLNSPFGKDQLTNYEAALKDKAAKGEEVHLQVILTGAPAIADRARLEEMGASILRWSQVADVVEEVQRARTPDWYEAARRPGAPAELRVLTEFAVYLEEEVSLAVSGPLDNEKLSALQNIDAAMDACDALVERVADILYPGGERFEAAGESDESWLGLPSIGWWNEADGMLYLWTAPQRWFADERVDDIPSFGVVVEVGAAEKARVLSDQLFLAAVKEEDLQTGTYAGERTLLVGDSVELASVADRTSLSEQADELARFAREVIKQISRCRPTGSQSRAYPVGEEILGAPLDPDHL